MFQDSGCGKMLEEQILSSLRRPLWLKCLTVDKEEKRYFFTLVVFFFFTLESLKAQNLSQFACWHFASYLPVCTPHSR